MLVPWLRIPSSILWNRASDSTSARLPASTLGVRCSQPRRPSRGIDFESSENDRFPLRVASARQPRVRSREHGTSARARSTPRRPSPYSRTLRRTTQGNWGNRMSRAIDSAQRVLAGLSVGLRYLQSRVWSCSHAISSPFAHAFWNSVLATDRSWPIP